MKYRDAETGRFVSEDAADADRAGTTRDGEQIITITDVRAAGHCVRGARDWFAAHDLDFADFLANGIDRDLFLATGDALAQQVVERVDAAHG